MAAIPGIAATLSLRHARKIWLRAQRLDSAEPFGALALAVPAAVAHLGYVQIDTINVIERCHHHILWNRIPAYRRAHLHQAQSTDKSVFEYWTHALAYVPVADFMYFMADMKRHRAKPVNWFGTVTPAELRRVVEMVEKQGPLSIRDIDDDVLEQKNHPWASRKPSKRALQKAFFEGLVTISERSGMLKSYELTHRHFGWAEKPRAASEKQKLDYLLNRALRSQGLVSLDSICHLDAPRKAAVLGVIEARVKAKRLVPVVVEGAEKVAQWATREVLETLSPPESDMVHILSPFDPLVIQRKRLKLLFGYDHLFEAYLPKEKRKMGYFALPVLDGDEIVAAIDLKTDRSAGKLLVQQWTYAGIGSAARHKRRIEAELHRFERFQLGQ